MLLHGAQILRNAWQSLRLPFIAYASQDRDALWMSLRLAWVTPESIAIFVLEPDTALAAGEGLQHLFADAA